jgi:hypothetical protein
MTAKSKILLHSIRQTKKSERRELFMSHLLGRILNGIIPTKAEEQYSRPLTYKTIRRNYFINIIAAA